MGGASGGNFAWIALGHIRADCNQRHEHPAAMPRMRVLTTESNKGGFGASSASRPERLIWSS